MRTANAGLVWTLAVLACLCVLPSGGATGAPFTYGGASAEALALYRQGWVEILRYGRWTDAERLYRQAVTVDTDFPVARSVLARIVLDPAERSALYRQVEAARAGTSDAENLLLRTYQTTLELFAMRERGEAPPDSFRSAMARQAVQDYGEFLRRYPGEWSVMIEYVEWIHALDGPEAALEAIQDLREASGEALSFSYFEAYFYAELGHLTTARKLAGAFRKAINDPTAPQPDYLDAYIAYQAGNLPRARTLIDRALALDPRHLIAERLAKQIEAAMSGSA